jgi:hypothetical protein
LERGWTYLARDEGQRIKDGPIWPEVKARGARMGLFGQR